MSTGAIYERKAQRELEARGFQSRRCAASAFPDIIAWDKIGHLFVEVKHCNNHGSLLDAKSSFRVAARAVPWPEGDAVQLWVYMRDGKHVFDWVEGSLIAKGKTP